MPRKRPPAVSDRSRQPAVPPTRESSGQTFPAWQLALLGIAVIVWLALYFTRLGNVPELHLQQRLASLNFLAAPDELFLMWCGGKLAYFSILDRWPILLLTAVILAAAWLAGRLAIMGLGLAGALDRLERFVFALGLGLQLVSLYALLVGLAGGLQSRWLFVIPIGLLLAAQLLLWRPKQLVCVSEAECPRPPELDDHRWLWWLAAALPFALVIVWGAMMPPWDYDVREYHLQAPKEWHQNGRIAFLPHNVYANMPLGSELTALWGMALVGGHDGWWWGALAGKTVMACYSLVAAAGLVALGRRLHSLAAGVIAALVFLSAPWIVSLATAGYNEGPVALYSLLTIYGLWLARRPECSAAGGRLVVLAGFCAGAAVGCKYPPALFLVLPLTAWLLLPLPLLGAGATASPAHAASRLRSAALFLAAAAIACGPWFIKNWVQTGNPTYPLLYSAFDGRTRTPEKDAQWKRVHSPQPDAAGRFSPAGLIREIAWSGWRTLWASLLIPPAAAALLLHRPYWPWLPQIGWFGVSWRPNPDFDRRGAAFVAAVILWMVFVFLSWWLLTHRLDRFLVLALPLAALLAALGVFAVPHPAWRSATLGLVLCGAAAQFPFVALHPDNRYFAPLDRLRRDDRELGNAGLRVEAAHRWLNEHAQPGEKVLLLGDAEPFDLELPAVYNTCFDDCQFTRIFQGRTRAERLAVLRAEKIAYVFCSWAHLARYRSPGNYGYTSDYPTPQLVHHELVGEQRLLIPMDVGAEPERGELFRVASE